MRYCYGDHTVYYVFQYEAFLASYRVHFFTLGLVNVGYERMNYYCNYHCYIPSFLTNPKP